MATDKPTRHTLTTEDRRRGALKAAEVKRERSKPFRQRLAEKLDERAEEIAEKLLAAGEGDWRAFIAAIDQAYGKPADTQKIEHEGSVTLVVESAFAATVPREPEAA